ncbi:hypothetical protein [Sandarakinorhabdus sp.]|uniref:hypothetical protein n=1 Tax=Sandarakinorhabdus sp. TaxID=1916663 RepID=UPI00286E509A|nr:hypothetical protein [Sandarakinorhabdus sp.]
MFKIATSLLLVALMVSLAAPAAADDKGLGLVTQNNIAMMTVDLTPSYAGIKIEGGNGMLADTALTRYRTGQVKPLRSLSGESKLGGGSATGTDAPVNQQAAGPR